MNRIIKKKTSILIVCVLLLSLVFTGCGQKTETPEQAVTNALNAIKKLDIDTMRKYFNDDGLYGSDSGTDELLEDEEGINLLFGKMTFKIISSSTEGDNATVKTEITNIDMASVMVEYFDQAFSMVFSNALAGDGAKSDEEMEALTEQLFIDLIKREDNQMKTTTVDIKLTKNKNSWKIESNDELQDAIFGGMISSMEEMLGEQ